MESALSEKARPRSHRPGWLKKLEAPFLNIKNVSARAAVITLLVASLAWLVTWIVIGLFPLGEASLCTNDGYAQYMPFLSEFWSIFREGGSVFYSWNGGLGGNFFLTIAYYLMSPFTFVALLFDRTQIPFAANLIIVLKNILVCTLMAWYLPTRKGASKKAMPAAACAITYGFGFYFMGYAVNFMWMDSIALLPLMLYGMERLDTRKGRAAYLFSLAAAIFMNFYMGAILCIFLALYEVVLVMRFKNRRWVLIIWFALCSLCAALLASLVLLPVIEGMLMDNVSRMSPPDFEFFNDWAYFFSRLLPDANIVRITHNRGAINLYMGSACLMFCLVFLFQKSISWRTRLGLSGLCLLYVAATQCSWLNYAFHGFYMQRQVPNRFGFLVGFLSCLMMYDGLVRIRKTKLSVLIGCGVTAAIAFSGVVWLSQTSNTWIAPALVGCLLCFTLAAGFHRQVLLSWLILAESFGCLAQCAPGDLSSSFTNMKPDLEAAQFTGTGRSDILCSDIVNAPALYGFRGVSSFNSVINPDTASILGKLGYASGENYYRVYGHTSISDLILGVDLYATDEHEQLPEPFVEVARVDDLVLWKSPYATPIGSTIFDGIDALDASNKFTNLNTLMPDSFTPLDVKASIETDAKTDGEFTESGTCMIEDIEDGDVTTVKLAPFSGHQVYVYGTLGGSSKFKVFKNDQLVHEDKYDGEVVYVGDVAENDFVELQFTADSDRDSQTLTLYAASMNEDVVERAVERLNTNGLKDQSVEATRVTGNYESQKECDMVFTIPYDPGWKATVNGQSVPCDSFMNGFLKIHLPAGLNQIELTYQPQGLKSGLLGTAGGIIYAVLILKMKDDKPYPEDEDDPHKKKKRRRPLRKKKVSREEELETESTAVDEKDEAGNQTISKVVEVDFERLPKTESAGQDRIPSASEDPKPETPSQKADKPAEKMKAAPDREKAASKNSNKEKEKAEDKAAESDPKPLDPVQTSTASEAAGPSESDGIPASMTRVRLRTVDLKALESQLPDDLKKGQQLASTVLYQPKSKRVRYEQRANRRSEKPVEDLKPSSKTAEPSKDA